jgi:hypothetical protein
MKYAKPEITSLASAGSVIQGQQTKPVNTVADTQKDPLCQTVTAYEADE